MSFKYDENWAKEILYLASKTQSAKEAERFDELLDMAEHPNDVKTVETLMRCLMNDDMGEIAETFYGHLSNADFRLYYKGLFRLATEFLTRKHGRDRFLYLLENYSGQKYTPDEWQVIKELARKNLNKQILKDLLVGIEEEEVWEEQGYPYHEFKKLFKELLREKSEQ
jgi:hypothetical protein